MKVDTYSNDCRRILLVRCLGVLDQGCPKAKMMSSRSRARQPAWVHGCKHGTMKGNGNFMPPTVCSYGKYEDITLGRGCMLVAVAVGLFLDQREQTMILVCQRATGNLAIRCTGYRLRNVHRKGAGCARRR